MVKPEKFDHLQSPPVNLRLGFVISSCHIYFRTLRDEAWQKHVLTLHCITSQNVQTHFKDLAANAARFKLL